MTTRNSLRIVCCLAGLFTAAAAHADIKVTSNMKIDSPQMRAQMPNMANIPAQYRSMIESMMNQTMTIMSSGKKTRVDTTMMSTITDTSSNQTIMLNNMAKTYWISTYDPNKMSMPGGRGPAGGGASGAVSDVKVTPTGNTKTLLGHTCHEYIVTSTINADSTPMTMKDDCWIAKDLAMPSAGMGGPLAGAVASQLAGFPLESVITMSGGQANGTTMTLTVTDISTDTLPSSTFGIPSGYTQSSGPSFGGPGMMGGPMGGMGGGGQ